MRIQDFNVTLELRDRIRTDFNGPQDYSDLRGKCLTTEPIAHIITDIRSKLATVAQTEKKEQAAYLVQHAVEAQRQQDEMDQLRDSEIARQLSIKRRELDSQLIRCHSQLDDATNEVRRLEAFRIQINIAATTNRYTTQHTHPSQLNHRGRVHVAPVGQFQPLFASPQLELARQIQRQFQIEESKLNTAIAKLVYEEESLVLRGQERRLRNTLSSASLERALSPANARALQTNINVANKAIDENVSQKITEAKALCHSVFLDQLHFFITDMRLTQTEVLALGNIMLKMQRYNDEIKLTLDQNSELQKALQEYNQAQFALEATNRTLETNKDLIKTLGTEQQALSAQMPQLKVQKEQQVTIRNRYTKYTAVSFIIASTLAMTGFALMSAGMVLFPPAVPAVFASVMALTLFSFLCVAGVAAIQAYRQQSKIDSNIAKMGKITRTLCNIQENSLQLEGNLPQQKETLKNAEQKYLQLNRSLQETERNAETFLCAAKAIDLPAAAIVRPSAPPEPKMTSATPINLNGFFYNPNEAVLPSAPPPPYDDQHRASWTG